MWYITSITSAAQCSTRRNHVIFAVLDVSLNNWALTVIKLQRFFCITICCFSTRFYFFLYHSGTFIQVSSKLWMFLISTPRTFTVWLAVTTWLCQGNGFAADVLLGRDHPRVVPISPIVRGLPILGAWRDATTQVASQSVQWQASYGISNIFQQRLSAILNFNF